MPGASSQKEVTPSVGVLASHGSTREDTAKPVGGPPLTLPLQG